MKKKFLTACIAACLSTMALADNVFTIKDIRIEGLQKTEPATIFSYLPVQVGDEFNDSKAEEIIKSLFETGFFDTISVGVEKNDIVLNVVERPVISTVEVTGGKTIANKDIVKNLERIGIARSKIFNPIILKQVVQGLQQEYIKKGKNEVKIVPVFTNEDNNRIKIEIQIEEGKTTTIRNITFTGNEVYSNRKLRNEIKTSQGGMWSWLSKNNRFAPDVFSDDLEKLIDFYNNEGYFDAAITSTEVEEDAEKANKLNVEIGIYEGPRYKWDEVVVTGDTAEVDISELQKLVTIKAGKVYKRAQLTEILTNIKDKMGEYGYAATEIGVDPQKDDDNKTVRFVLDVDAKKRIYINQIRIAGNNKTRDQVIRREIRQMESAPYDIKKIKRSKERIELLGYFDDISIEPSPVAGHDDKINLDISVKERPTGSMNISVGYVQDDGFVFSGGIDQDNLFGTGKSVGLRASTGGSTKQGSISFTDPYFTVDGVSLGYDAFWRSYNPDKLNTSAYKTETYGAGMRMGVPISEYDRVNFGLGANNMKITLYPESPKRYVDFVEENGRSNWTLSGNIGWGRNTTDSSLWPTRGYIISANADLGLPGGDMQFYKLNHEQKWFFPLSKNFTLSLNGRIGYADGYGKTKELPFFHNYYGGGLGSVRGYESSSLGPKTSTQYGENSNNYSGVDYYGGTRETSFSAELLFPFPGMKDQRSVRLSLFADAGSVWDGKTYTDAAAEDYYGKAHKSSFKEELRYSTGLAFTWLSPMGPMKFSYALPLGKKPGDEIQRFQFQLGTVF